ncbi:hypothetical protein [Paenibacillus sp. N3.4]|uniref:hypothetical protein n=1 Tax=Paenibacillus sp. N3.4 TaxID=2603222 RepID=UPI0011C778B2|nr:hypothetical protein [Paenibacillus sp. N3.4]TXK86136.1 hypothetical protein FU659_01520 [Paenibacillus sp. N3.4]
MITSSNAFKIYGGVGAIASGIFLFLGHLLLFFSENDLVTELGKSLVLFAHLILVFAFIGLYEEQAGRNGILGTSGMLLGVVGTIFVTAIVYVELLFRR